MKNKKILFIALPVLCAVAAVLAFIFMRPEKDALKFKKEYEALNGQVAFGELKYSELEISENNPMKYADYGDLLEVIHSKSGIIYLGFPGCPWCRSALPVLLDVAKDNNIETIYYMNIQNERDSFVVENEKLVYQLDDEGNEKKGTEGYFMLMDALSDHLTDYVVSYEGKDYETGEKRIYAPTIIFVKEGQVLGLHVSTVESHKSGFDKMTEEQVEELYGIYEDYILEMNSSTCSNGEAC